MWKQALEFKYDSRSCVNNLCIASDSAATCAVRDSNVTVEVVGAADTTVAVGMGALAAVMVSAFRASCSNSTNSLLVFLGCLRLTT